MIDKIFDTIIKYLGNRGVLWDVGWSLGPLAPAIKQLRPNATIIGFEPVPMSTNMGDPDITIFPLALGAKADTAELHIKSNGLSSFHPSSRSDTIISCRIERGDDLVLPSPTVIKLAVNGYETEVLRGMPKILRKAKAVIFECHADGGPIRELLPFHPIVRNIHGADFIAINPISF